VKTSSIEYSLKPIISSYLSSNNFSNFGNNLSVSASLNISYFSTSSVTVFMTPGPFPILEKKK
jgi:hypothetical protein